MTGGNRLRRKLRRNGMKRFILLISILSLAVAACGTGDAADGPVDSDLPTPTLPPANPDLPPGQVPSDKQPTRYDKVPDNAGQVFIDSSELLIMESFPIQVSLGIEGTIPTPCHGLGWVDVDDGTTITVTVFSIEPGPAVSCIAVEEPFALSIPLGSFAEEDRSVILNGEVVGDFSS